MNRHLVIRVLFSPPLLLLAVLPYPTDLEAGVCSALTGARRNLERIQDAGQLATERVDRATLRVQDLQSQAPAGPPAEVQQADDRVQQAKDRLAAATDEEAEVRRSLAEIESKLNALAARIAAKESELATKTSEYDQKSRLAAAARRAMEADADYAKALAQVESLKRSVAARTGPSAAARLAEGAEAISNPAFRGDPGSELDRLARERDQLQKRLDALFIGPDHDKIREALAAKKREISRLRASVRGSLEKMENLKGWDLLVAEERAKERLTPEQRTAVERVDTLRSAVEGLRKDRDSLRQQETGLRARQSRAQRRLDDNRQLQIKLNGELKAAYEALRRAQEAKTPAERELEAARSELQAAIDERDMLQHRLAAAQKALKRRERQWAQWKAGIQPRVERGKWLARSGAPAKAAGDVRGCLEKAAGARDVFLTTLTLVRENRECLDNPEPAIQLLIGYLDRMEQTDCGGRRIGPAPRDGRVEVPPVIGLRREEAAAAVRAAGLTPYEVFLFQPSAVEQAGKVKDQRPASGSRLAPSSQVRLLLYNDLVKMPAVDGGALSINEAITVLAGHGLFGEARTGTPDAARAGKVYSQSVAAGTEVLPGRQIDLLFYCDPAADASPPARCPGAAPPAPPGGSSTPAAGFEITERRILKLNGKTLATFEETLPRTLGSYTSAQRIDVPDNAAPGVYTFEAEVSLAGLTARDSALFEIR